MRGSFKTSAVAQTLRQAQILIHKNTECIPVVKIFAIHAKKHGIFELTLDPG